MIDYIKTILPRIKQFSKELNDTANFADIPWGFVDDDGDKVTYLFRRNNELLVSKKGDVASGKWEYLPVMQSLLIEHAGKKRMYNQGFLDKAVMVLRKDGTEELLPLVNSQLIPDMDIVAYLESKVVSQTTLSAGDSTHLKAEIEIIEEEARLKNGELIIIVSKKNKEISFGNYYNSKIFKKDKTIISNGTYVLSNGDKLTVKDEKVISVSLGTDRLLVWVLLVLFVVIPILLYIFTKSQNS